MNKRVRLCLLILGDGTIFKLSSMKDAFYVPVQNNWGLTNTQIGLSFMVYTIVQTTGLFLPLYIVNRYSKKISLPFGPIGIGLCGLYLAMLPSFIGYLVCFAAMVSPTDVVYWLVLLKAVRLLGTKEEQGRMFGFLEAGCGVADVIVASSALFIFVRFGEGRAGVQAGLLFYTVITLVAGIVTYFIVGDDKVKDGEETNANMEVLKGVKHVLSCPSVWLASLGILFVYTMCCGLTYFVPLSRDIYMLPVVLIGAYGIINQYTLKMVGGPIGGTLAGEAAKSPTVYLKWTFLISVIAMLVFVQLPHQTMNMYTGMAAALGFGATTFSQRVILFAPMDEIDTPRECVGLVMVFSCTIGYMPATFAYILYGYLLGTNNDITGYNYIFSVMIAFSLMGLTCPIILAKQIKKQKLAATEMTT